MAGAGGRSLSMEEVRAKIRRLTPGSSFQLTLTSFPSVEFVKDRAAILRAQVGNDTDIVGVVPRAVGSTFPPVTCDATDDIAMRRSEAIVDAQPGYHNASLSESYALGEALGLDCGLVTPDLVPYVGTVFVARDMNHVLQALGQDKLSYL